MNVLLDTNICIHYLNGTSESVRQKLRDTPVETIRVNTISVAELYYGACKSQNPARNVQRIEGFTDGLVLLPFDEACMPHYGEIRAGLEKEGTPIGGNDLFIAAIAKANKCTLVTGNTREFEKVEGLNVENWIEATF